MSHSSHFKVPSIMELYLDCRLQHNSERLTWQYPAHYFIFRNHKQTASMAVRDTLKLLINWYLSCASRSSAEPYIISKVSNCGWNVNTMCYVPVAGGGFLGFHSQQCKTKSSESKLDKRRWKKQSRKKKKHTHTHHHQKQQLKMAFKVRKNT